MFCSLKKTSPFFQSLSHFSLKTRSSLPFFSFSPFRCFSLSLLSSSSLSFFPKRQKTLKIQKKMSSSQEKEKGEKRIGTHDGSFHCDEALACFFLLNTKQFSGSSIVRTRNPQLLNELDIVVDVGAIYDPPSLRFDHHQSSFSTTFGDKYKVKLSSAGLVYKHFGKEVVCSLSGVEEPPKIDLLYQKIYDDFVLSIDGIDNGVEAAEGQRNYRIHTDLSSRVGRLNPSWQDPNPQPDAQFQKAVKLCGEEFVSILNSLKDDWLPARVIVEEAMMEANRIGKEKNIICFDRFVPWKEHLVQIEEEKGLKGKVQYAIYPDQSGSFRVHGVPLEPGSFALRTPLPASWRGMRDDELSDISQIPGCVFVHASGFIGGNKTREGALQMAFASLELGSD